MKARRLCGPRDHILRGRPREIRELPWAREFQDWWWMDDYTLTENPTVVTRDCWLKPILCGPGRLDRSHQNNPLNVTDFYGNYRWQATPPPPTGEYSCPAWPCGSRDPKHKTAECFHAKRQWKCIGCASTKHLWGSHECTAICEWCGTRGHAWFWCSAIEKGTLGKLKDSQYPGIFRPAFLEVNGKPLRGLELVPLLGTQGLMIRSTLEECAYQYNQEQREMIAQGTAASQALTGGRTVQRENNNTKKGKKERPSKAKTTSASTQPHQELGPAETLKMQLKEKIVRIAREKAAKGKYKALNVHAKTNFKAKEKDNKERKKKAERTRQKLEEVEKRRKDDGEGFNGAKSEEYTECWRSGGLLRFNPAIGGWRKYLEFYTKHNAPEHI
ncbi:MAG: hypothetical protein Q9170_007750 [Blastenia crenularia]